MKYALIGCGRIAGNHIHAAITNGLEIVAVCDTDMQHAEALLRTFHLENDTSIVRCSDYRRMLEEHPEIELCAIATPSGLHAALALDCIDHGKNVIIEKPMAMSMADADELICRAEQRNVLVSVCHQNRFNAAVQQMRTALELGRFGKLSHGSIQIRWHRDEAYYTQADWRGTWAQDGGCLMNQCIHGIDLLRWMMGDEVDTVYGCLRQCRHPYLEAEDVGSAIVQFRNGAIATIEGSTNLYGNDLEESLFLCGTDGTAKISGICANEMEVWQFVRETAEDSQARQIREYTTNVYGNGHVCLYADMIDAIVTNRRPYIDAIAGRNALEMILAIYKSHQTGRSVKLPLREFSSMDMAGTFSTVTEKGREENL